MGQPHSTTAFPTHNYLTPPNSPPRSSSPTHRENSSRDISPLFRLIDANTYDDIIKDSKYQLPSEDEHIDRIQLRHLMFKYVWQGNFSAPVEERLKNGAKVLDVG
jgi:hypothetical protein